MGDEGVARIRYYRLFDDIAATGMNCTDEDLRGFDRQKILLGQRVDDWDERITLFCDEDPVMDWLPNSVPWPVFSARICAILAEIAGPELQFLPVRAERTSSGRLEPGYQVLNILHRLPALDLERSTVDVAQVRGQMYITGVRHYVLKSAVLQGYNVVRLEQFRVSIVVSDRIKEALEAANVTGCEFIPLRLS